MNADRERDPGRRMKVAIIVHGGVDRSGTEHVIPALVWLIERLARRNEVHVFARAQEPGPGEWDLCDARVHNIGLTPGRRQRLFATFGREHAAAPFDVVQGVFGWGGSWAALLGMRHRLPVAFHAAGDEFATVEDIKYGMRSSARGRLALSIAVRGAARVTVATQAMQSLATSRHVTSAVTSLGVALDQWPLRTPRARERGCPARLLHVGDLRPVKDQATLLSAAANLNERGVSFELDICGLDTLDGALQQSPDAIAIRDRTRWHGSVNRVRLREFMERADVLLVSSRHEAGPLVVLEAAIAGVPTVGTHVGHVADWAPDAAVAVPVGDAAALADATSAVLDDEERRLRIAGAAQQRALAIDADYTAASFERMYGELCAR